MAADASASTPSMASPDGLTGTYTRVTITIERESPFQGAKVTVGRGFWNGIQRKCLKLI